MNPFYIESHLDPLTPFSLFFYLVDAIPLPVITAFASFDIRYINEVICDHDAFHFFYYYYYYYSFLFFARKK
jgi:hypothetical protein